MNGCFLLALPVLLVPIGVACSGPDPTPDLDAAAAADVQATAEAQDPALSAPTPAPSPKATRVPVSAAPETAMLVAELEVFLHRPVADNMFSGAVLVAKDGDPIFRKAYGLASKRFNVPNRVDTKFNVGSLNKMFTAVAITQLAEQGKLSLNDPVSKHLRDYPSEVADKVIVHQLLTHTSGLGDFLKDDVFTVSKASLRTVEDHIPLFVDNPLVLRAR